MSFLVLQIVVHQGSPVGFVMYKTALREELSVFVELTSWSIGISVDFARFELLTAAVMMLQVFSM